MLWLGYVARLQFVCLPFVRLPFVRLPFGLTEHILVTI